MPRPPTIKEAMELLKQQRAETARLLADPSGTEVGPEAVSPPPQRMLPPDGKGIIGTMKQLKERRRRMLDL